MEIGDQHIRDFIVAWREEFSEEIAEADARLRLNELVELYLLLLKPLPNKEIPEK